MENKFTYNTVINSHDTDAAGIVRASCLLKYMQEAAGYQTAHAHPSTFELREDGKHFVVTKLSLTVHTPLYAWDEITVSSWACPSKGATFNRCATIEREGVLCATLCSAWALLDVHKESIVRVSDVEFDFGTMDSLSPLLPMKVRIPSEIPLRLFGEHTVRYRDIDVNSHMNNTVYADILYGFLRDCEEKRIEGLAINFLHEAPAGSTFKVYGNDFSDICYFRTVLPDGSVGIEAEAKFTDLD